MARASMDPERAPARCPLEGTPVDRGLGDAEGLPVMPDGKSARRQTPVDRRPSRQARLSAVPVRKIPALLLSVGWKLTAGHRLGTMSPGP
jgi:hypothetical protein